jgi:hypothetical protein
VAYLHEFLGCAIHDLSHDVGPRHRGIPLDVQLGLLLEQQDRSQARGITACGKLGCDNWFVTVDSEVRAITAAYGKPGYEFQGFRRSGASLRALERCARLPQGIPLSVNLDLIEQQAGQGGE